VSTRTLAVVSAGLGRPSSTRLLADQLAAAASRALSERGDEVVVEVVEVRDLAHDVVNALLTGFPAPELEAALTAVAGADGVVAVTPVFNASYSGLFKSFVDVLPDGALDGTPVLAAATGGTARHSLVLEHALRPMLAHLRAAVVPTTVFAASEDWGSGGSGQGSLAARVERAGGELAALVAAREASAPVDPFEEPTPFERLLLGPLEP
jgi:FMN reductase